MSSTVTSRDGTEIVYFDEGRGRSILIVHPGSSDAASWQAVADGLSGAGAFRVLRFERRLYGKSGPPRSPHAIAREVEDVEALLARIGAPTLLVGHSSGAVVALETALKAPAALAGLVAYEPPLAVTEPLGGAAVGRAQAALARGDADAALTIHLREIVRVPWLGVALARLRPSLWRSFRAHVAGQIADDQALDALGVGLDRYRQLTVPTLLVGGGRSLPHLRQRLAALAAVIPTVRETVTMPRHGHGAHQSAPRELAMIIHDFAETLPW